MSFHTRLTLRASDYAPPDTGVSNLQLVAVEYLPSIEGAGQIYWSAPFRGEFFICTHPMPSPMRGRRHGEAVTDEVGQFRLRGAVHLISRLRRQLPLIGEASGVSGKLHKGRCTAANLQLRHSIFFCFSKRKRWQKKKSLRGFRFPLRLP